MTNRRTLTSEEFLVVQLRYLALVAMRRRAAEQANCDPSQIDLEWTWDEEWEKARGEAPSLDG